MYTIKEINPFSRKLTFMVIYLFIYLFISNGATAPSGPGPPHYRGFTITLI
jgi:hypothetical protein